MTTIAHQFRSDAEGLGESFFDLERLLETLTAGRITTAWLLFGLAAQLLVIGCLFAQWYASKRHGRIIIRPNVIYVGLIATVMLLVYASIRHDLVYVVGQLLNVMIGLRLLEMVRRSGDKRTDADAARFPQVKPESAERGGHPGKRTS